MNQPVVAAAQWKISFDRSLAASEAIEAEADELHLDFGGAHRGPYLSERPQMRLAKSIHERLPIPVLAVNYINDVGLTLVEGAVNPDAIRLLKEALDCAYELDIHVLHVPGFRRNAPRTERLRVGSAIALRSLCEYGREADITIAYESALGASDTISLAEMVEDSAVRFVLDIGNLVDVGEDPTAFAATIRKAGLLAQELHVKDPAWVSGSPRPKGDELLSAVLDEASPRSVLVENEYRPAVDRLRLDISLVRRFLDRKYREMVL